MKTTISVSVPEIATVKRRKGQGGFAILELLVALIVIGLIGYAGYYFLNNSSAQSCTVTAKLVNPCRPWLGGWAQGYTQVGGDFRSQITYQEQRIGRQLDVVHDYHGAGAVPLATADEQYFATRPNTILSTTFKPSDNWKDASGGNAAVNAIIDQTAQNIKSVAPHKVMLTIYLEPENEVSGGGSCAAYKGTSGTTADYRAMWKNVHNRFSALGVTNVVWVWNVMGNTNWACELKDMWPGNNMVDWITWDPYVRGGEGQTFAGIVSPFYNWLSANSDSTHAFTSKPWGLSEWGAYGVTQPTAYGLYDSAKSAVDKKQFPRLKMYSIFDTSGVTQDVRLGYDENRNSDPVEQQHYNAFANDNAFKN